MFASKGKRFMHVLSEDVFELTQKEYINCIYDIKQDRDWDIRAFTYRNDSNNINYMDENFCLIDEIPDFELPLGYSNYSYVFFECGPDTLVAKHRKSINME